MFKNLKVKVEKNCGQTNKKKCTRTQTHIEIEIP